MNVNKLLTLYSLDGLRKHKKKILSVNLTKFTNNSAHQYQVFLVTTLSTQSLSGSKLKPSADDDAMACFAEKIKTN